MIQTANRTASRVPLTVGPSPPAPSLDPPRARRWTQTYTGRRFCILDPRAEDVCIEDIATALSRIQRGGGHYRFSYTVAQHSHFVSELVPTLAALLHDAAEAYIGDVITTVKDACPELRAIEKRIQVAIGKRFGIDTFCSPEIKHADLVALATERRDLMGPESMSWGPLAAEFADQLDPEHAATSLGTFRRRDLGKLREKASMATWEPSARWGWARKHTIVLLSIDLHGIAHGQ